jgi:hypothetical protein
MLGTGKTITTSLVDLRLQQHGDDLTFYLTFLFLSETDDCFAPAVKSKRRKGHFSVRKTFNYPRTRRRLFPPIAPARKAGLVFRIN